MIPALLLSLLPLAFAGQEDLPKSMQLNWNFSASSISFTLTVPIDSVSSYDWWGICLKPSDQGHDMDDSDCVTVVKGQSKVDDRYALTDDLPPYDTDGSGQDSFTSNSVTSTTTSYVAKWTRLLNTNDNRDIVLVNGNTYNVLYAFGKTQDSVLQEHADSDRGYNVLTLTESYVDDGSDDTDDSDDSSIYYIFTVAALGLYAMV